MRSFLRDLLELTKCDGKQFGKCEMCARSNKFNRVISGAIEKRLCGKTETKRFGNLTSKRIPSCKIPFHPRSQFLEAEIDGQRKGWLWLIEYIEEDPVGLTWVELEWRTEDFGRSSSFGHVRRSERHPKRMDGDNVRRTRRSRKKRIVQNTKKDIERNPQRLPSPVHGSRILYYILGFVPTSSGVTMKMCTHFMYGPLTFIPRCRAANMNFWLVKQCGCKICLSCQSTRNKNPVS